LREIEVTIEIKDWVKAKYGSVATSDLSSDHLSVRAVAEAFGYTPEELAHISHQESGAMISQLA
jgi:hypothetical protein